jgi:membrane protein
MISKVVPIQSLWLRIWPYVQWLLAFLFIFAAIDLLYRWAPKIPAKQRLTVPGALFAASMWLALSWGLSYYLQHFGDLKLDRLYEVLASPIALIVWLYWSAIAILIGAEINVNLKVKEKRDASLVQSGSPHSNAA